MNSTEDGSEIVLLNVAEKLKEEIRRLQQVLAALTSERDDLRYHICPELMARYAREIGNYENRINYQQIMILEMKRRIEIERAALNREKTVSEEDVDEQVREEYAQFHRKVEEEYQRYEQAEQSQRESEEKRRRYEQRWQERYGGRTARGSDTDEEDESAYTESSEEERDSQGNDGSRNRYSGDCDSGDSRFGDMKKKKAPDAKELYRKIVKKLHPDMNPHVTERQKELFYKAVEAYKNRDIETLQEIYDEVFGDETSDNLQGNFSCEELTALRDKLADKITQLQTEIHQIKEDFPYRIKEFLDDSTRVSQRQKVLREIIRQNEETLKRLMKILENINREMKDFQ